MRVTHNEFVIPFSMSFCCFSLQSELATGKFPFRKWNSVFEQLAQVVKGDPPTIVSTPELPFNEDFVDFVSKW